MGELKSYFQNKRNLISLLSVLILTLALPLAIFLVRNQQIFKSRAAGGPPIKFSGANVVTRAGKLVALNPQVVVELSAPYPPRVLSAQTSIKTANQSIVPKLRLVSQVKAQEYLGCLEDPSICTDRGQICDWYNSSSDADGCISAGGEYLGCYDGSYTCPSGTTCDWFNPNSDANGCIADSGVGGGEYLGCYDGSYTCPSGTTCDWFNPNSDANGCIAGGGGGSSQCAGGTTSCYVTEGQCDQATADSACGAYYQDGSYCDPNNRGSRGDGCIGPGGGGTGGEPNSCEGYFQNCWEPVNPADPETQYLEGTQWCFKGSIQLNGACGYDPQFTSSCESCQVMSSVPPPGQCPANATACWIGASCSGSNQTLANETCGRTHPEFPKSICTPTEGNPDTYFDGCTTQIGGGSTPPPGGGQTTPPPGGIPSVTEITIPKSGWGGPGNPTAPLLSGSKQTVKIVAPNSAHIDVYLMPFFGLSSFYIMNPDTSNRTFNPFSGCGPSGNVNCNDPQCPVAEPGYLEDQCWLSGPFGGLIRLQGSSPARYDKSVCKPVTCGNNKPGDEWWDPPAWTDADQIAWQKYLVGLSKLQRIYSGPADKFTSWQVPTVGSNLGDLPGGEWFMLVNAHTTPNAADNWGPNDTGCAWNRKIYRIQPGGKFGELEINTYINDANGRPEGACNNVSSSPTDNNMPVVNFWIGYKVGDQTVVSTGSSSLTPRPPSPIPSGLRPPGTTPTQPPGTGGLTTISYKIAENPTDLDRATVQPYTEPLRVNHTFTDTSPGQKFIWVEFTLSDNTKPRFNASIDLVAPDPVITSCRLIPIDNDPNSKRVTVDITGTNLGTDAGIIQSGSTSLPVVTGTWTNTKAQATFDNPPLGQSIPILLTRKSDGQKIDGVCSSITQIFFSGRLFCPQVNKNSTFKGELTVREATPGAQLKKSPVTLTGGILKDLPVSFQEGVAYKLGIKIEKGLRKVFNLTATIGTLNISNVILPLGDLAPAPTGDGKINSVDKAALNQQWGPITGSKNCDLNSDGVCNSFEWACMREFFNQEDEPEL